MIPKQTAVEWLVEHILTEVRNYEDDDIENEWDEPFKHEYVNKYIGMIDLSEYVIKAKEMEKQQIIEAHGNKERFKCNPDSIVTYGYTFTGEMYYNKTFKNTENENR
jgi:hypothetical protein